MSRPHARHIGEAREELTGALKKHYEHGASIRQLADAHELSYGKVHRLLVEAGVDLRGRGGPRRQQLSVGQVRQYRERLASARIGR